MPQLQWLTWARKLQAISQTGITYSKDPYHLERFVAIREIAAEIIAQGANAEITPVLDIFSPQVGE